MSVGAIARDTSICNACATCRKLYFPFPYTFSAFSCTSKIYNKMICAHHIKSRYFISAQCGQQWANCFARTAIGRNSCQPTVETIVWLWRLLWIARWGNGIKTNIIMSSGIIGMNTATMNALCRSGRLQIQRREMERGKCASMWNAMSIWALVYRKDEHESMNIIRFESTHWISRSA